MSKVPRISLQNRKSPWAMFALALTASFFLFAVTACNLKAKTYASGDARIHDSGGFSLYPRFEISFDNVELVGRRTYEFTLEKPPSTPLTFFLRLLPESSTGPFASMSIARELKVLIATENSSEATLVADGSSSEWVLNWSQSEQRLWHNSLRQLKLNKRTNYVITISVPETYSGPAVHAIPAFWGGGSELP